MIEIMEYVDHKKKKLRVQINFTSINQEQWFSSATVNIFSYLKASYFYACKSSEMNFWQITWHVASASLLSSIWYQLPDLKAITLYKSGYLLEYNRNYAWW